MAYTVALMACAAVACGARGEKAPTSTGTERSTESAIEVPVSSIPPVGSGAHQGSLIDAGQQPASRGQRAYRSPFIHPDAPLPDRTVWLFACHAAGLDGVSVAAVVEDGPSRTARAAVYLAGRRHPLSCSAVYDSSDDDGLVVELRCSNNDKAELKLLQLGEEGFTRYEVSGKVSGTPIGLAGETPGKELRCAEFPPLTAAAAATLQAAVLVTCAADASTHISLYADGQSAAAMVTMHGDGDIRTAGPLSCLRDNTAPDVSYRCKNAKFDLRFQAVDTSPALHGRCDDCSPKEVAEQLSSQQCLRYRL